MANSLTKHIAAMKPTYIKEEFIPESVKNEILESENGQRALKKFIKRDVLWQQELATSEKSESVGQFFKQRSKAFGTEIAIKNWALFMIE
jgi:translation elongation factor EF-Ts